jgi:hypothetical protein
MNTLGSLFWQLITLAVDHDCQFVGPSIYSAGDCTSLPTVRFSARKRLCATR